ncbi:transcriptional regulator [Heyndrickxia shackletonii]|uniref:Transcriptional regulator n=1 Tax=Heyndrickxia shackletonii TaxID=157838 RepID=A0A0Q3WSM3_9BACI|nr:RsfA family transcriptional regulator [Heyndrickxia shackletonii]KQL51151.1 transcriptional regulator [Heyndrickxia shackletonii]NEZ00548.1 RsfA family transcriptional regulator [Heyndrickxia shackletonii]RTZ57222.1 RsfA family transcriptional regulator [Bacillus sp. SAJ1]
MKSRQDAWTDENDLILAETVLRHVREGSTQLNAFEEVGDRLNRTSAACGFRWNAVVRHNYEQALQLAKKQRKQRQRLLGKDQGGKKKLLYQPPTPTLEDVEDIEIPLQAVVLEQEELAEELTPITTTNTPSLPVLNKNNEEMSLSKVIGYLQYLNNTQFQSTILKSENARLKHELSDVKRKNEELQKRINELEQNSVTMQEDYETLMKIMNRARKLVLFDEDEPSTSTFKMDRNGNLEKLAE